MTCRTLTVGLALVAAGLCAQPALAAKGDWLLRAGVGVVDPKGNNLTTPLGEVEVDSGTSLTIEGTYMFTDNLGVELLASWPFSHDINLDGTKIGETKHLPPTVSVQYHFNPAGQFRPYVGVGINYTNFFDEDTTGPLAGDSLKLDDSWGLAAQAGIDIGITDRWFGNFVVRYADIDTDAKVNGVDLGTVEIDPWVYQAQIGYRFGK